MVGKNFLNLLLVAPVVVTASLIGSGSAIASEAQTLTEVNASDVELSDAELSTEALVQPVAPVASAVAGEVDGSTLEAPLVSQVPSEQTVAATPASEFAPLEADEAAATAEPTVGEISDLAQLEQYTLEGQEELVEDQVTSVSQLADVQPTDWAFQALQNLVERYGCIAGYPDGTFRGNRALTRYEFAAGLNACLDRIVELIQTESISREELAALQRMQEEFSAELTTIRGLVDNLEARTAELEANQFSTTTKLVGEVIFSASEAFGGSNIDIDDPGDEGFGRDFDEENNTVFQYRTRLNFDTSFAGTDQLRVRLQTGNFERFIGDPSNGETRLGYEATNGNTIVIDDFFYRFNASDQLRFLIYANGADLRDLVFGTAISPFISSGSGAVSRFGRFNPIYRIANSSIGASFDYRFTNPALTRNILSLQVGYGGGEGNNPSTGNGLFNGDYGFIAQLAGRSFLGGDLDFALTYINAYSDISTALNWGVGSRNARVSVERPVSSNSYGLELNYRLSPTFQIGGWAGYTFARALEVGDAEVFNFAVTLAFPDLGGTGNLGGIVFGMQPRLVDAEEDVFGDLEEDPDTGFHVEGFYRLRLTDNIAITPGVIWLTAPNHDNDNDDIVIGTIRTTFSF